MVSDDWRSLVHPILDYQADKDIQVFVSSIQALHCRLQNERRLAVLQTPANDFADRLTKKHVAKKVSAAVEALEEAIRPENQFVRRRRPIRILGTDNGSSLPDVKGGKSVAEQVPHPLGQQMEEIPAARQLIDQLNQSEGWVWILDDVLKGLEYLTRRALQSNLQRPLETLLGTLKDIRGAALARREVGFYCVDLILKSIASGHLEALNISTVVEIQAACRQLLATDTDDEWLTVTATSRQTGIPKYQITKLCNASTITSQGEGRERRVSLRSAEKWNREHEKQKDLKAHRKS